MEKGKKKKRVRVSKRSQVHANITNSDEEPEEMKTIESLSYS